MGKQEVVRLTPWQESNKIFSNKYSSQMRQTELYREQSKTYGNLFINI